ncbi:CPK24 [Scenedesmus sp. PABB004]|nr:CPK24 [Scenedesmus sp. PABB004]
MAAVLDDLSSRLRSFTEAVEGGVARSVNALDRFTILPPPPRPRADAGAAAAAAQDAAAAKRARADREAVGDALLAALPGRYFEPGADALRHELAALGDDAARDDIDAVVERLEGAVEAVSVRLAKRVIKNQDTLIAGITNVTQVEDDLRAAHVICCGTRAALRAAGEDVATQLRVITCTRRKQAAMGALQAASRIKQVKDLQQALRRVHAEGDHAEAILMCADAFGAVAPELALTVQRQHFDALQQLDAALARECGAFSGAGYSKLLEAYLLAGQPGPALAGKVLSSFKDAINDAAARLVRARVLARAAAAPAGGAGAAGLGDATSDELCRRLAPGDVQPCLAGLLDAAVQLLTSFHAMAAWHAAGLAQARAAAAAAISSAADAAGGAAAPSAAQLEQAHDATRVLLEAVAAGLEDSRAALLDVAGARVRELLAVAGGCPGDAFAQVVEGALAFVAAGEAFAGGSTPLRGAVLGQLGSCVEPFARSTMDALKLSLALEDWQPLSGGGGGCAVLAAGTACLRQALTASPFALPARGAHASFDEWLAAGGHLTCGPGAAAGARAPGGRAVLPAASGAPAAAGAAPADGGAPPPPALPPPRVATKSSALVLRRMATYASLMPLLGPARWPALWGGVAELFDNLLLACFVLFGGVSLEALVWTDDALPHRLRSALLRVAAAPGCKYRAQASVWVRVRARAVAPAAAPCHPLAAPGGSLLDLTFLTGGGGGGGGGAGSGGAGEPHRGGLSPAPGERGGASPVPGDAAGGGGASKLDAFTRRLKDTVVELINADLAAPLPPSGGPSPRDGGGPPGGSRPPQQQQPQRAGPQPAAQPPQPQQEQQQEGSQPEAAPGTAGQAQPPVQQRPAATAAGAATAPEAAKPVGGVQGRGGGSMLHEGMVFALPGPGGRALGLKERVVAAECLTAVADTLRAARPSLLALLGGAGAGAGGQALAREVEAYMARTVDAAADLRDAIYRGGAKQLLARVVDPERGTAAQIAACSYAAREPATRYQAWAEGLVVEYRAFGQHLGGAGLPPDVQGKMWEAAVALGADAMLDGLARVGRCSIEGRAAMSLDLSAVEKGLRPLAPAAALSSLRAVDAYIKAFYIPWDDLGRWAQVHLAEYGRPKLAALVEAMADAYGVKRGHKAALLERLSAQLAEFSHSARSAPSSRRSVPSVRVMPADPGKAAAAAAIRAEAVAAAEAMFAANAGASFRDTYVRATLVSYGGSAKVFTAVNKHTQQAVAIKAIAKSTKSPEAQRARVLQEVGAMLRVQHHPHAVRLLDAFEDARGFQLVMQLLKGGELFEHITSRAPLTEAGAAALARSLLQYVAHAHGLGVAHMDIKPENVMFDSEGAGGVLKVIDLGSAEFVCEGEEVPHAFGTVRYSSPEMAAHSAGPASDVLSGCAPFVKSSDCETLSYIARGPQVKFSGSRWRSISAAAKDCVRAMLAPDPAARPSAAALLRHPWLAAAAPGTPIAAPIVAQLQLFAGLSRARRVVLGLAANCLSGAEASAVLASFLAADSDFNGTLDYAELASAAKQAAPDLGEGELRRVFEALDVDNTGTVDAQEFIAGVLQVALAPAKASSLLESSFHALDREHKGHLTRADLVEGLRVATPSAFAALHSSGSLESELDEEFAALDANGDGVVTLEEFRAALSLGPDGLPQLLGGAPPAAAPAAAAAARRRARRSGRAARRRRARTRRGRRAAAPPQCTPALVACVVGVAVLIAYAVRQSRAAPALATGAGSTAATAGAEAASLGASLGAGRGAASGGRWAALPPPDSAAADALLADPASPEWLRQLYTYQRDALVITPALTEAFLQLLAEQLPAAAPAAPAAPTAAPARRPLAARPGAAAAAPPALDLAPFVRVAADVLAYLRSARSTALLPLLREFAASGVLALDGTDPDALQQEVHALLDVGALSAWFVARAGAAAEAGAAVALSSAAAGGGGARRLRRLAGAAVARELRQGSTEALTDQLLGQMGSAPDDPGAAPAAAPGAAPGAPDGSLVAQVCAATPFAPGGLAGVLPFGVACPAAAAAPPRFYDDGGVAFTPVVIPLVFHVLRFVVDAPVNRFLATDAPAPPPGPAPRMALPPLFNASAPARLVEVANRLFGGTGVQFTLGEVRADPSIHAYLGLDSREAWQACTYNELAGPAAAGLDCLRRLAASPGVAETVTGGRGVNVIVSGSKEDPCYCGAGACRTMTRGLCGARGPWFLRDRSPGWSEGSPADNWVQISWDVLDPAGLNAPARWDGGGAVLAHELGHFLGVLHPHEGGCENGPTVGDGVADTPGSLPLSAYEARLGPSAVADLAGWCADLRTGRAPPAASLSRYSSCPGNQTDSVLNVESYTPDACAMMLTPGQVSRMQWAIAAFRPKLMAAHAEPAG